MTADRSDTSGETTMSLTHSCSNHGMIQVGPLSSDAMFEVVILTFEVVEISDACFVHLLLQYVPHKNYENWLNFVKVLTKILLVVSFVISTNFSYIKYYTCQSYTF